MLLAGAEADADIPAAGVVHAAKRTLSTSGKVHYLRVKKYRWILLTDCVQEDTRAVCLLFAVFVSE